MSCQDENKFVRFSDTPSIDKEGFVRVASSKEQLENMSLQDKERVVASVALLDAFTKEVQNKVEEITEEITNSEGIDEKIKDIVKNIQNQEPQSLDILKLFIIPNINGAELRWNAPSYKKNYVVKVYQKYEDDNQFSLIDAIDKGRNYHLLNKSNIDLKRKPKWYVRAYDGETAGTQSNEVMLDTIDWSDIILGILHGKITETALSRGLLDSIYSGFSEHLSEELKNQLERARTIVQQTEQQINSTISGLRERIDQDIIGVKQQLLDHGTGISTLERKSNEHAERIDTISAVAQGAVSGLQQEKVARATAQEAYARETNTKIAQVQGAIGTVRQELETKSSELESVTTQVNDFRNTYNQNETRRTEEITSLTNADKALNEKLNQVDAKTVNSQAKITALENVVAEKDRASTKRFSALRSSINGSHFPNYNFEDNANGWTTLQGEVSIVDTKDNSAPQKMALQALGNMPVTIHSNEPTRIEQGHTYALSGVLKCPDGAKKVELVMMCFDKDKNFITNIQTNPQYPLIDSKTNAGNGWVVLEGQISGNTTSWPTTDNTKIPMHAQYASPALIVTTTTGGKIWVTKLDMQDTSESEKNKALIKALETTQNTDRESIATTLREQETRLKNGFSTVTQQLQNKVTELGGKITAESSKIEDLTSEVGGNRSKINSLTKVINDDRSSNAAKFETLNTKFKRDLSNAIINPTFTKVEVTSTLDSQGQVQITGERTVTSLENWNCEPKNKFSVITFQENQSQELKTKSPSNYYLKFWGNSLVPDGKLVVNPNDKIYVGLHAHNLNDTNAQIVVRYLNKDGEYLSQENLATFKGYTRINTTLTVPSNADKAELVIFTNSNVLAERQAVIISKPELRMNMAAIYADGKFEEAKTLVSNAKETVVNKIDGLEARYNNSEATNRVERQAIARKNEAISGKVDEQATKLGEAEGKIRTIESTQSTDKAAFTTFQRDITSKFEGSESKINELKKTTNDRYQSLAEKTNSLESNFNTVDGKISTAINSERSNTLATAKSVSAEVERTLSARLGAAEGKITEAKNIAVDAQGKVNGKIGLKLNANGKAVGWSSEVNGESNNFSINADNFKIANGNDDYTPFSINATERKIMFNGEVAFTKGTNLLRNPILSSLDSSIVNDYRIGLNSVIGWRSARLNGSVDYIEARSRNSDWSPDVEFFPGELCINIRNDNISPRGLDRTGWLYQDISVTPGTWYMFSAWTASHGSQCRLKAEEINSNGGFVKLLAESKFTTVRGGRNLDNYERLFVKFKATSPNVRLALEQANMPNQAVTSVLQSFIFRPMLEQCSENATSPSAWSNSSTDTVIDGSTIRTGAVTANLLSADVLNIGVNLIPNASLKKSTSSNNPVGWYIQGWSSQVYYSKSDNNSAGWTLRPDWLNNDGERTINFDGTENPNFQLFCDCSVKPNTTYILSYYYQNHGVEHKFRVDFSSMQIGGYEANDNSVYRLIQKPWFNRNSLDNSTRTWYIIKTPPNVTFLRPIWYFDNPAGQRKHFAFFRPMLEEVHPSVTTPSPWKNSNVIVTPSSIYADSLSSISANMGHITAGSININGKSGINSDGHLWATGANINGTITATGGSITGDLIVGNRDGGYVLISGSQKAIIVYEGTVPKVRLGKLS
ncbi:MAG: hypothetical protein ACTTIS_00810 [Streptobacillus sp.]